MDVTLLRGLVVVSAFALAAPVCAQEADESILDAPGKTSVIQPVSEPAGAVQLRAAIRRISYNPSDADALADAGDASLSLGDANAALNFFTRANSLRPKNSRITAGLATATVRTENPFEALRLFDDAVRLGVNERSIAADRAMAFDLLGNFDRAQQDYRLARSASSSDDLLIKQAISLSLAGQAAEADAMLVPLLQKNNPAAWRARAFMLASRGDFRESSKVAQGFMDAGSAQRMERYLRLMPELTGAQQAGAIHLGHFPASQYVGRDSEDVRRVASTIPPVQPTAGESRLIPTGTPLGSKPAVASVAKTVRKSESRSERRAREREEVKIAAAKIPESARLPKTDPSRLGTDQARAKVAEAQTAKFVPASATTMPPPETARALVTVAMPVRTSQAGAVPAPMSSVTSGPSQAPTQTALGNAQIGANQNTGPAVASPAQSPGIVGASRREVVVTSASSIPAAAIASAPTAPLQGPMPDGAAITTQASFQSASAATVAPASTPAFDLAAVVGAIEIPESEQKPSAIPVDLKKIKPAAPKIAAAETSSKTPKVDPKVAAKAKAEAANPARYWVQIATGDAGALGFDYRKFGKKTPDLFKSQSGWTSEWGKTDRLLVGPFADMKAAKKWEGDFKKAGGDGFMWKSENGVVVTALKSK
jgi:Flp pilus assembly protein TadD